MCRKFQSFFVLTLGLVYGTANASGNAAAKLAESLASLSTYQANFEQQVKDELGTEIDHSSGIFSIKKPNLFRWQVLEEFPQIIVADGKNLWTYDQELEQVTIQNQKMLLAESPMLLMTSNAEELSKAFKISVHDLNDSKNKQLFLLKPKSQESVFDAVNIMFAEGKIIELLMSDTLGQKTSVKFTNVKINQELEPELFTFVPPEGVDVVDSRESKKVESDKSAEIK